MEEPVNHLPDHCAMIELALSQRCDLQGLRYLRANLTEETLDVARWMTDTLSGSARLATLATMRPLAWLGIQTKKQQQALRDEYCARVEMLDQAIETLQSKIASEVDIAISKQSAAYARYGNTRDHIELWKTRLAQLQAYGDRVKAMPVEQLEAESQILQLRAELVQRQGDWHQAVVELALAVGCIP